MFNVILSTTKIFVKFSSTQLQIQLPYQCLHISLNYSAATLGYKNFTHSVSPIKESDNIISFLWSCKPASLA